MQGNTFTNNANYDYTTACTTGTFSTMKAYIDAGLIQMYTSDDKSKHIADCYVYGSEVAT